MRTLDVVAISTRYAGCHFRSRLEARWAVFFDEMCIPWEYEPEGYELSFRRYLPDFLLTDCGTFIEVRGSNDRVNLVELERIANELPAMPLGVNSYVGATGNRCEWSAERGPRLMLLGPMPRLDNDGDPGWLGTDGTTWARYGFGEYHKNKRPWHHTEGDFDSPLLPTFARWEYSEASRPAIMSARSARFEFGESGAT